MKQLKYDSENTLRLEIPPEWKVQNNIQNITVAVKDTSGNSLLSAANTTLYSADTLASAASSGDNTVTLTTGNVLSFGERIRLYGSGNTTEDRTVLSYVASTKVVTLSTVLDYDHSASSEVHGLFATYAIDMTDNDVYSKNRQLRIIWTSSDIKHAPYTELAEVAETSEFSASDFDEEFSALYPREYENARERLTSLRELAERRLGYRLQSRGMNMDRVQDQRVIMDSLLSLTRYLTIQGYGDDWEFEINQAWDQYLRDFEDLCSLPIWVDDNQDEIKTEDEVQVFEPLMFGRNM
jgi:hypothetical protein